PQLLVIAEVTPRDTVDILGIVSPHNFWSCTCPIRINIAGSPVDCHRDKKAWTRGLSWHPGGPFTPGDALTAGRADTPTPRQLTATRRSLPCSLFLTPALAAARAAPDTTALLSGTTHGQSAPRPSPAYRAASALRSPCRWWAGTGAGAGVGWHAASRSRSISSGL